MAAMESSLILLSKKHIKIANMIPKSGPPNELLIIFKLTIAELKDFSLTILIKSEKRTIATPSLSIDSPSISVLRFLLAPNYFNKATTATGSVADKIDPNVNP